ncbi:F-box domain containing protein [Trema orientale]|uniref:F-box domain containing protein n=1 Tax=Trema orientale TaxID=63057 RepID=A0A2P5CB92_TREOI|nr:F-box domain containing protein [Trema orientale]
MRETKIVTYISSSFLPEDIIKKILLRLDVKSLMRFRCVCKSWQSLICEPTFTKMHFNLQPSSIIVFDNIFLNNNAKRESKFLVHGSGNFGENSTYKIPENIGNDFSRVVGCDGGILCLSDFFLDIAYLWNPATNEVKKLPPSPRERFFPHSSNLRESLNHQVGFGIDRLTNDFKVLRLRFAFHNKDPLKNRSEVAVYSLRTNSWKTIENPRIFSSSEPYPSLTYSLRWSTYSKISVVVNGSIHWMFMFERSSRIHASSIDHDQGQSFGIVAFDLNTEVFSMINLPQHKEGSRVKNIGKMFECLSFIFDAQELIEIWVMKEHDVKDSWIKHTTVDLTKCPIPQIDCFCAPFSLGNKSYVLFYSDNKLVWYDVMSDALGYLGTSKQYVDQFALYAESIVQIGGDKDFDEHHRMAGKNC